MISHEILINENDNLCPICYDNIIIVYADCNHGYCNSCYNKINICAICRKSIIRKIINNNNNYSWFYIICNYICIFLYIIFIFMDLSIIFTMILLYTYKS